MGELKRLGQRLRRMVGDGRGRRYSAAQKREILAATARARRAGATWSEIVSALGVPPETVRRWQADERPEAAPFVPVAVVPEPPAAGSLSFVAPSGYRVEGITLDDAVALLRRLS